MLQLNSANEVLPGGPVSRAIGAEKISGAIKRRKSASDESTSGRSTIAGARILAGVFETARRILQHSVEFVFDFAGLEWNGHAL